MKKRFFSLLFSFTVFLLTGQSWAQSNVKEAELSYYGSLPALDRKFTEVISPDLFLIYNSLGYHRSCIIAVNNDLVEQFRIKVDHSVYYPYFRYDATSNKIIVIETGKGNKVYQCFAKVFDGSGKLLMQKTLKAPGEGEYMPNVKFSETNNMFMIYSYTGKKGQHISYSIYDNALSQKCTKEFISKGKEKVIDAELNSEGESFIVYQGTDSHMKFARYDNQGNLVKELLTQRTLEKKEFYKDFQIRYKDKIIYAAFAKHNKEAFTGTDIFTADFNKDTATAIQSVTFTGENLNKLYTDLVTLEARSNTLSIDADTVHAPLQNYYISNLLIEDKRVYVVSECLYKKTEELKKSEYPVYYAENILISAFSLQPDSNVWNKMISRKNQDKDNISNLAIQEFSSIKSESYIDKKHLNLLTLQPLKDDFSEESLFIRKINKEDGSVEKSARLLKDSFTYDRNFTNWLDQFHLIIYRTNRPTIITKFLIDIIEID
jgi:hypothetical protein